MRRSLLTLASLAGLLVMVCDANNNNLQTAPHPFLIVPSFHDRVRAGNQRMLVRMHQPHRIPQPQPLAEFRATLIQPITHQAIVPTIPAVNQQLNQPERELFNQPVNQRASQPFIQPVRETVNQPASQLFIQPTSQTFQPVNQAASQQFQPASKPFQPVNQPFQPSQQPASPTPPDVVRRVTTGTSGTTITSRPHSESPPNSPTNFGHNSEPVFFVTQRPQTTSQPSTTTRSPKFPSTTRPFNPSGVVVQSASQPSKPFNTQHSDKQPDFEEDRQRFPIDTQASQRNPVCYVKPDPGSCRAAFPRYYFDPETGTCNCFLYGGCREHGKKEGPGSFLTLHECQRTCQPPRKEEGPVCKSLYSEDFQTFPHTEASTAPHITKINLSSHLSDEEFIASFFK